MKATFDKAKLLEIEKQLSCPSGEQGKAIGKSMHERNLSMTIETITALQLKDSEKVLELGMGTAGHLKLLLQQAPHLQYVGLEISLTMLKEAERINEVLKTEYPIILELCNGEDILFPDGYFNKIFTVNTLYFWPEPLAMLNELYRVLHPAGSLAITFAHKSFMEQLPFVGGRFSLYDPQDVLSLIDQTDFQVREVKTKEEVVMSKSGDWVNREFSVLRLLKNQETYES